MHIWVCFLILDNRLYQIMLYVARFGICTWKGFWPQMSVNYRENWNLTKTSLSCRWIICTNISAHQLERVSICNSEVSCLYIHLTPYKQTFEGGEYSPNVECMSIFQPTIIQISGGLTLIPKKCGLSALTFRLPQANKNVESLSIYYIYIYMGHTCIHIF